MAYTHQGLIPMALNGQLPSLTGHCESSKGNRRLRKRYYDVVQLGLDVIGLATQRQVDGPPEIPVFLSDRGHVLLYGLAYVTGRGRGPATLNSRVIDGDFAKPRSIFTPPLLMAILSWARLTGA